eukprot:scaffold213944_cov17-Tisochrysis_lutea.AAC.1
MRVEPFWMYRLSPRQARVLAALQAHVVCQQTCASRTCRLQCTYYVPTDACSFVGRRVRAGLADFSATVT